MVEVLGRVLDSERFGVGFSQRVPNDIEPIRVAKLHRLIPFVGGEADVLAAPAAFDFDSPDAGDRVAVAGLRVRRAKAADIETDFEMADALGFPAARRFVGDDDVFGGQFALAGDFRVKVVEQVGNGFFGGASVAGTTRAVAT